MAQAGTENAFLVSELLAEFRTQPVADAAAADFAGAARAAGLDIGNGIVLNLAIDAVVKCHAVEIAGLGETDEIAHVVGREAAM